MASKNLYSLFAYLFFNLEVNDRDNKMYKLLDKPRDMKMALKFAQEFNYNKISDKIPLGIFYQKHRNSLNEEWPILNKLVKQKKTWIFLGFPERLFYREKRN